MQKTRFFLKGSAAETQWLNQQAQHGQQLTQIVGCRYQFEAVDKPGQVLAEYLPAATLTAMAETFKPLASYRFKHNKMAVAYSCVTGDERVVKADDNYRLTVTRQARDYALNCVNGAIVGFWLLMCAAILLANQTRVMIPTKVFLGGLGLGTVLVALLVTASLIAAIRLHRQVHALVQLTGNDKNTWKPTFHVMFRHQKDVPDTDQFGELGKWLLSVHNNKGDYYFDLRSSLSEYDIRSTIQKVVNKEDFTVMSCFGLYPL
ncbi:hypothetical protein RA086_03250 [Lactiplantibacillus sp. WILCCON 0030]|uniref:DUF2812 domain-containing protein n=1 Tax=Lactiplantibacillus brownii TaxID=3069269 RepID=A0ABU1A6T9_9LACO|nr:hypothetical protein [Lactiplantibacillus brownii]MDQ7936662.1 hypothetical protein [Lactiplantibacillus brownii]